MLLRLEEENGLGIVEREESCVSCQLLLLCCSLSEVMDLSGVMKNDTLT
jgi:hypothetical protein